ncbi:MAG: hypothetical protein AAGF74_09665 [Pseudomonadota bacterium]
MVRLWVGLAFVGLAACAHEPRTDLAKSSLILADSGLNVAGTGLEIGFGRAQAGAVASVSRFLGLPSTRLAGAGCTAVRWNAGFEMVFLEGDFSGWRSSDPDLFVADAPAIRKTTDTAGVITSQSAGAACAV